MLIYPKEDIINPFGQVLFKKGKGYECEKVTWFDNHLPEENNEVFLPNYVVKCELIANEYPILNWEYIKKKFNTIEDIRNNNIETIIK
jgi:hypothetical protein